MATNNAINSLDPIEVAKGGTGNATLTDHGVLVGSGTSPITVLAVGTTGQLLVGSTNSDPAFSYSADGNFTFTGNATQRRLFVENTDTSGTGGAQAIISVGGANAGDPILRYNAEDEEYYTFGIDNSADDAFKISGSTTLGTDDFFVMTTDGELTLPVQPSFASYSGGATDVTGAGTLYTVVFANESFDQAGNFDGTSTFTASATGSYYISVVIALGNISAAMTEGVLTIHTSNRDYFHYFNPENYSNAANNTGLSFSTIADFDTTDTATIEITVSNGAGDTADVLSGSGTNTVFTAYLMC